MSLCVYVYVGTLVSVYTCLSVSSCMSVPCLSAWKSSCPQRLRKTGKHTVSLSLSTCMSVCQPFFVYMSLRIFLQRLLRCHLLRSASMFIFRWRSHEFVLRFDRILCHPIKSHS